MSIIPTRECIADSDFDMFILGSATLLCDAYCWLPVFGYGGGKGPHHQHGVMRICPPNVVGVASWNPIRQPLPRKWRREVSLSTTAADDVFSHSIPRPQSAPPPPPRPPSPNVNFQSEDGREEIRNKKRYPRCQWDMQGVRPHTSSPLLHLREFRTR